MSRLRLLQVPLVLALFAFLALQLDLEGLGDALTAADPLVIAVVIALNLPIAGLFGLRMHLVLLRQGHHLAPDLVVASAVVGNVAGSLTPASSGEILRAAALRSHSEVSIDDAVALITFERGMSLYLLALGTAAAAASLTLSPTATVIVVAGCLAALALPFLFAPLLDQLPQSAGTSLLARGLNRLRPIASQLRFLLRSPRLIIPWLAITAAIFGVFTTQYWLLGRSVEDVVSPREMWVAAGASQLAAIITLIPLGIGASDASLAAILNRFGMSLESGAAVAILGRATSTLPLIILAAAAWVYLSRKTPIERAKLSSAPAAAE